MQRLGSRVTLTVTKKNETEPLFPLHRQRSARRSRNRLAPVDDARWHDQKAGCGHLHLVRDDFRFGGRFFGGGEEKVTEFHFFRNGKGDARPESLHSR